MPKRKLRKTKKAEDVRLPKTVQPTLYNMTIAPDFETYTFRGHGTIDIDIQEETKEIVLHAQELLISHAVVAHTSKEFDEPLTGRVTYAIKKEQATFAFPKMLPTGKAVLHLKFAGILNDQMAGFYRSFYTHNGVEKVMATTQFEDTDARRAFPCWDEPNIKAKFKFTFNVPKHLTVVSNMPVAKTTPNGSSKTVEFETTPVMSTYNLAFPIGEFEYVGGRTKDGVVVRVLTTPGKKEEGRFALDFAIKCLEYYNDYFKTPYPLPKLDLIAIPDFAAGAMENWGAVTFRETALLVHPVHSSLRIKQRVAIVIAHELAHMWFGDLVTMEWWTQLWLNEGFASCIEYFAVNHIFPEWKIWEQFIANDFNTALSDDALRSTHSIEVPINHPSEIRQTFDSISYSKGASIVRMIHDFIGDDAFRKGMRMYFKKHAYANANTEDLWTALEKASGKPVKQIMDTWTKQPGYPVLSVQKTGENKYRMTQSRFIAGGKKLLKKEKNQVWHIPLSYRTGTNSKKDFVLVNKPSKTHRFPDHTKTWFKMNTNQITLARIAYPKELWKKLAVGIERNEISTIDRVGIANDIYALTKTGKVSAIELLETLKAFRNETDFVVWTEIIGSLAGVASILPEKGPVRDAYHAYGRYLLEPIVTKMGWTEKPGESHFDTMLRPQVLSAYGSMEHAHTLETAKKYFSEHISGNPINPNLRTTVFRLTAQTGNEKTHQTMVEHYKKAERAEERTHYLVSLGNFRDKAIIASTLDFSLTKDVRGQDMFYITAGVHRTGHDVLWKFMQNNWKELFQRYSGSIMMLTHLTEDTLSGLDTEEHLREIKEFFKKNPAPEISRSIAKSLERVRTRINWRKRDYDSIAAWLKTFNPKTA